MINLGGRWILGLVVTVRPVATALTHGPSSRRHCTSSTCRTSSAVTTTVWGRSASSSVRPAPLVPADRLLGELGDADQGLTRQLVTGQQPGKPRQAARELVVVLIWAGPAGTSRFTGRPNGVPGLCRLTSHAA